MEEYIIDYLNYLLIDKGYSENTIVSYKNDLEKFKNFLKNKDINKINNDDIRKFVVDISKENYADKSINHSITVIRNFFKYLIIEIIIKNNPTEYIELPKIRKSLPTILSIEEVMLLLDIDNSSNFNIKNR